MRVWSIIDSTDLSIIDLKNYIGAFLPVRHKQRGTLAVPIDTFFCFVLVSCFCAGGWLEHQTRVNTFFLLFERLADSHNWSDAECTLQFLLTGKSWEAFSLHSVAHSGSNQLVKAAVLTNWQQKYIERYADSYSICSRFKKGNYCMYVCMYVYSYK